MRSRMLSWCGLGGLLVVALASAGGCLNPRPEDFPSTHFSEEQDGELAGRPGNSQGAGPSSGDDNDFTDEPTSPPLVIAPPPTSDPGDDRNAGDAGAPASDGGAAAAFAATADGGAAFAVSADACEPGPGPR